MERILILTADDALLDDVLRVVAAAGGQADVSGDVGHVRARWRLAPLVLLGADLLGQAVRAGLPRREGLLVVGATPPDEAAWAQAVHIGARRVLTLSTDEQAVVEAVGDIAEAGGGAGVLVGIAGGRGGAGASVLAAGVALAAARERRKVLLIDGDPLGGGLDLLFGAEQEVGSRWPAFQDVSGRLTAAALQQSLPSAYGVSILSHERGRGCEPGPAAMLAVAEAGRRAGGCVVVDLPRPLGAGPSAVAAAADQILLVVPADLRSCAAAGRVADVLCALNPAVQLVVRVWRGAPLTPDTVTEALQLPLAGVLRADSGLAVALADGTAPGSRGRGPLSVCSRTLVRDLLAPPARRAA